MTGGLGTRAYAYSTTRERDYNTEMGAPYSQDLRMRVLAAIDEGMSKTKVHQQFKVSRSTVDDWLRLRTETGKVEAMTDYPRGPAPALADSPELREFIEHHHHTTLGQLADAWFKVQGQRLSTATFSKTLKRLGYTRKKRVIATKHALPKHAPLSSRS